MTVEINLHEIFLTLETIMAMNAPRRHGKQTSQVGGLSPAHFDIALDSVKEGCLEFIRQLIKQLPTDVLPYLPRINTLISNLHQANLKSQ